MQHFGCGATVFLEGRLAINPGRLAGSNLIPDAIHDFLVYSELAYIVQIKLSRIGVPKSVRGEPGPIFLRDFKKTCFGVRC